MQPVLMLLILAGVVFVAFVLLPKWVQKGPMHTNSDHYWPTGTSDVGSSPHSSPDWPHSHPPTSEGLSDASSDTPMESVSGGWGSSDSGGSDSGGGDSGGGGDSSSSD